MGGSSSSGSSGRPQVTTETRQPWGPSEPHLIDIMGEAKSLYNQDIGYNPWTGPTQANLHPLSMEALDMQNAIAKGGNPLGDAAYGHATSTIQGGGLSPQLANTAQALGGVANVANTPTYAQQNLMGVANGTDLATPNPFLQATIEGNADRIMKRIKGLSSGAGRYGSEAQADIAAKTLAEASNPIYAEDYQQAQNRRLQANSMLDSSLRARESSVGGLLGAQASIYDSGANRAGTLSALSPTLDAQRYAPWERVGAVGDVFGQRDQNDLNSLIERHNITEARPWERLANYAGITNGMGAMGGTSIGTRPTTQASSAQRTLGGAMAGASLGSSFGPWGAGIGGIGGGLMGLFG